MRITESKLRGIIRNILRESAEVNCYEMLNNALMGVDLDDIFVSELADACEARGDISQVVSVIKSVRSQLDDFDRESNERIITDALSAQGIEVTDDFSPGGPRQEERPMDDVDYGDAFDKRYDHPDYEPDDDYDMLDDDDDILF
jgi:hypothetical protein